MMYYIGIPTVNSEEYLMTTLLSIRCKSPHKIFVFNNGKEFSKKTMDYIYSMLIQYDEADNLGIAPAWNEIIERGVSQKAEGIIILNDDIALRHDAIDILIYDIETTYDAVSSWAVPFLHKPVPVERYVTGMHFSSFILHKDVIKKVGLFDENFAPFFVEDTDYYYRMKQAGLKIGMDRASRFIHYKIRPRGNTIRWKEKETVAQIHNRNRKYFEKKHGISPNTVFSQMRQGRRE